MDRNDDLGVLSPRASLFPNQSRFRQGRLLLGGFEVGVLAGGVVGYVYDLLNLGDGALHGDFDSLGEGDRGHTAALASAGEPQVGGIAFDGHEVGPAAVDRD